MKIEGKRKLIYVFGILVYATILQIFSLLSAAMESICTTALIVGVGGSVGSSISRNILRKKEKEG